MQHNVCKRQKSPIRAGGCLAKSMHALSQAEAANYVLYFSRVSKKAVRVIKHFECYLGMLPCLKSEYVFFFQH